MNAHKDAQVPTLVIKPLDKDREKKLGTIRELIWSHWQQREVGQVVATWLSKEGDQSDCTFAIETDERGERNLLVTIKRPKLKGTTMEHVEYTASRIRRVDLRTRGSSEPTYVPEGEERPGSSYRLVFYDENGKEKGGV